MKPNFLSSLSLPTLTTTRSLQLFQVMRQGAVIVTSVLLAKSGLRIEEIGLYEVLLYIGTVLTFFWVNGLLQAMTPVYARLEQNDRKAFVFNSFVVFCGISILLFGILFLGKQFVVPPLTGLQEVPHFALFCIYLLFNLPTFPVEYIYLLHKKPVHIFVWGAVTFGLHIVAVILPIWFGYGLRESIGALAVLAAGKWLWTAVVVWQNGIWTLRRDILRQYLVFAWPLILNVLIGNFVLMFDNWLVGWWYHDEAVFAVFRYGARELPLAQALATALGVTLIPRLTENLATGLTEMRSMTRKLFHFLFPLTILLLLISKPLFPLIFNADFAASAPIFNIYLLMTASRLLLPNSIVLAKSEPRIILWIGLLELAVKIALGFVCIQYWGLPGVAWSAVLAFWVEKLGLTWYLRKTHNIHTAQWLDGRLYLGYVAAMLLTYGLASFL